MLKNESYWIREENKQLLSRTWLEIFVVMQICPHYSFFLVLPREISRITEKQNRLPWPILLIQQCPWDLPTFEYSLPLYGVNSSHPRQWLYSLLPQIAKHSLSFPNLWISFFLPLHSFFFPFSFPLYFFLILLPLSLLFVSRGSVYILSTFKEYVF